MEKGREFQKEDNSFYGMNRNATTLEEFMEVYLPKNWIEELEMVLCDILNSDLSTLESAILDWIEEQKIKADQGM